MKKMQKKALTEAKASNNSQADATRNTIRKSTKRLIIGLAVWRIIPPAVASWLIERGGLRDA
ncbi:hypothetical protein Q4485_02940 [Granulosicoccaceae sp. 1_MG-2023]|nr:hypothetical protein [Granulosicoccaceae sp. 1_MG-2023]